MSNSKACKGMLLFRLTESLLAHMPPHASKFSGTAMATATRAKVRGLRLGLRKANQASGSAKTQPSLVTAAPRKQMAVAVLRIPQSTSSHGFRSSPAPLSGAVGNEARVLEALSRIAGALCKRLLRPAGCTPGTDLKGITCSFRGSSVARLNALCTSCLLAVALPSRSCIPTYPQDPRSLGNVKPDM